MMFEPIFLRKFVNDFKFKNMLRISKTGLGFTKGKFLWKWRFKVENDVES
jgi:hypothetical protein